MVNKFEKELETIGVNLTDIQKKQFDRYYELLIEWNKVIVFDLVV